MRRTCEWARILWHHLPEGRLRVDKRASISPKMCHKSEREKNKQTNKKQKKALPDKGRQLFVLLLLSCFNCVWLFVTLWTVACQAPLSLGFSRQEYPNGLPFPFPGDLPNLGIEPWSPALQADSLPSEPPGKPFDSIIWTLNPVMFNSAQPWNFHLHRPINIFLKTKSLRLNFNW